MPLFHGLAYQVNKLRVGIEIWKALAEVDGIVVDGHLAHDGKYGGSHVG